MKFEDKVVVISGSGRGIGRTTALNFAAQGADIVVNYFRNRKPAENVLQDAIDNAEEVELINDGLEL